MSDRPPIPVEILRRVLVEAGHRCAIHTCKNPDVDAHHIIPWEKCREHSFENLIALCPNCHRRAHNGEIDRKSLLMYKARLSPMAAGEGDGADHHIPQESSVDRNWKPMKLEEQSEVGRKYSVQIEYPIFLPDTGDLEQLNVLFKADAIRSLIGQRASSSRELISEDAWWATTGDAYASSFVVILQTQDFISVRESIYSYFAGAAHPNQGIGGINYSLNPLISLTLDDILDKQWEALCAISDYCIKFIELENHDDEPNQWVRKGAGRDWGNFNNFNITHGGLNLIFNAYEVGSYAEGPREVFLSARFLTPFLKEGTRLKTLWEL